MAELTIRQMGEADIDSAMELKIAESWNQTEGDWRFFLEHSRELCLVACLGDAVVGTVTALNYGNEVSWIGMMLVSRAYRKQGIGRRLLETVIGRLDGCRSIQLDATPAGLPVYQKLGFVEVFGLIRMSVESLRPVYLPGPDRELFCIEESNIEEVARLDRQAMGADRIQLMRYLLANTPFQSWAIRRGNRLTAYVMGRRGTQYTYLGPVVADSIGDAQALVARVSVELAGESVAMDVPSDKAGWQQWLSELGFSNQRPLTRMSLGSNQSRSEGEKMYAICGPELG